MKILIAGAASGIGRATTEKLVEKGHEVIAFDIDAEALNSLPEEVETFQGDVRNEGRVEEVVSKHDFDVLVNSAGYYELGSIEDMPSERVEKQFETNVMGPLNLIRHSIPSLKDQNGRIVNITSVAGRISLPFFGPYCGTKHALGSISDSLAIELSDEDVEVVIVEPGPVRTGFNERAREKLRDYIPGSDYEEQYNKILGSNTQEGISAEKAAETVVKAALTEKPRRRYTTDFKSRAMILASSLLPRKVKEKVIRRALGY